MPSAAPLAALERRLACDGGGVARLGGLGEEFGLGLGSLSEAERLTAPTDDDWRRWWDCEWDCDGAETSSGPAGAGGPCPCRGRGGAAVAGAAAGGSLWEFMLERGSGRMRVSGPASG
jgi:hypothetical protein